MPREVKAYGCKYKCRQRVVLSKASMADHETRCFHNPEKKACATCVHLERQHDGNGMDGTPYNENWINLLCHAKEECMSKLESNCEFHVSKLELKENK